MAFSDPVFEARRQQILGNSTSLSTQPKVIPSNGFSDQTFEQRRLKIISTPQLQTVQPIKPMPTITPTISAFDKTVQSLNGIGNGVKSLVKKITDGLTFTFTQPKIISPVPEETLNQTPVTPQKPISINPNQTKLTLSQLNDINPVQSQSATLKPITTKEYQINLTNTINDIKKAFPQTSSAVDTLIKDPASWGNFGQDWSKSPTDAVKKVAVKSLTDFWTAIKEPMVENIKRYVEDQKPSKSFSEFIGKKVQRVTGAVNVLFSPFSALFAAANDVPALGTLSKVLTLPFLVAGEGAPKISNAIIDDLPLPAETKKNLKPAAAETLALVVQIAMGKAMEIVGTKAKGTIGKIGADTFEKITKNVIEEYNLPKTVSIPAKTVKDVVIGNNTGIERDMLASLGLSGDEWGNAVKKGITIDVPAEKITRIVDKPYWEKIKQYFGQAPTNEVMKSGGKVTTKGQAIAGYFTAGENTPEQIINTVIKNNIETTVEGKNIIKTALEAKTQGKNIIINNEAIQPVVTAVKEPVKPVEPVPTETKTEIQTLAESKNVDIPKTFRSQVEEQAFVKLLTDTDKLINEYIDKYGNVVNADKAKSLFPEYNGTNAIDFDKPSGNLSRMVYERLLTGNKSVPDRSVAFSSGGTGSGKTTSIEKSGKDYTVVFDSTLSDYSRAQSYINKALGDGYAVDVYYTFRPVEKAYIEGVLERYNTGERRTVPIKTHVNTHINARDAALQLYENFKADPKVRVLFYDNSGTQLDLKETSLDKIKKMAYNKEQTVAKLYEHTKKLYEQKRISESEFNALTGTASKAKGQLPQGSKGITSGSETATAGEELTPSQKPVGEGELKSSRVYERIRERYPDLAEGDLQYNKMNIEDQIKKSIDFVASDKEKALRVAFGLEEAPIGLNGKAVNIVLADKALRDGNFKLWNELEQNRSLRQTRAGQDIVLERGRFNDDSPHVYLRELLDRRLRNIGRSIKSDIVEGFNKMNGAKKKAIEKIDSKVKELTEKLKRRDKGKIKMAQDIIDSLTCK